MDEVHFQQYDSSCRMGIAPGVGDAGHYPRRKSMGYFDTVRLRHGRFVCGRERGCFNAQTCWHFLRQIEATSVTTERRVVVIIDIEYAQSSRRYLWRRPSRQKARIRVPALRQR